MKTHCSVAEALQITGLGKTSLYREIGEGRLKAVKCGRRTLIPLKAIEEWAALLPSANPMQ